MQLLLSYTVSSYVATVASSGSSRLHLTPLALTLSSKIPAGWSQLSQSRFKTATTVFGDT